MAKICSVCKKPIKSTDDLAVLSYPIRCISSDGSYDFSDFLRNERVIHFDCLNINKQTQILLQDKELAAKCKELMKSLDAIGSVYDEAELTHFVASLDKKIKIDTLMDKWFKRTS